jgi:hypothetical protein
MKSTEVTPLTLLLCRRYPEVEVLKMLRHVYLKARLRTP